MLSRLASLSISRSPVVSLTRQSLLRGASSRTLSVVAASRPCVSCAGSIQNPLVHFAQQQHTNHNHQQIRTKTGRGWTFTKQRQKRMARAKKRAELRARGIPLPKPPNYMPRDLPVINAQSDEQRKAEIQAHDARVTEELHAKLQAAQAKPLLRFHMTGLRMSDRVRKLFDLHNGNQKEVVKAQKQRGMEVFQLRPGDTGSSAVQGMCLTIVSVFISCLFWWKLSVKLFSYSI